MIFGNSVLNSYQAPAIWEDTLANRPNPSLPGRLFVRTDNPYGIYRDTGSSWINVSGGGGGSQNWDNVLLQGGYFTDDRSADIGGYSLDFNNFITVDFTLLNGAKFEFNNLKFGYYSNIGNNDLFDFDINTKSVRLGSFSIEETNTFLYVNTPLELVQFASGGIWTALFYPNEITLGDVFNVVNSVNLYINNNYEYIKTSSNFGSIGLHLDFYSNIFQLGDFEGNQNGNKIVVEDNNYRIYTVLSNNDYGIDIDKVTQFVRLGDYGNNLGSTILKLDTDTQKAYISAYGGETSNGVFLDFNNGYYFFGDNGDWYTESYLGINAQENNLVLNSNEISITSNYLYLNGYTYTEINTNGININGSVLSTSSGSVSSQHLVLTINGNQYKIQLRNP